MFKYISDLFLNVYLGQVKLLHVPSKDYIVAIKCFQISAIFCSLAITVCHVTRLLVQKCLPYAPGFEFLQDCKSVNSKDQYISFYLNSTMSTLYWASINLIYFVTLLKLGGGCMFVLLQLYFVESCCIRFYLKNLLVNISSNRSKQSDTSSIVRLYKQLQLILRFYNQINQDIFVIVVLQLVGLGIIIGLFALISSWSVITNLQCFVLLFVLLQSAFGLMICFGNFAGIYEDSLDFIARLRLPCFIKMSFNCRRDVRQFVKNRKVIKSLFPLKVRIGSVNYVDRFTPITFTDLCFGTVVNMLLLK